MMLINMGMAELEEKMFDGDMGYCLNCGEETFGVEPDARQYKCEACGQNQVYGLSEILIMGQVSVIHD